MRMSFTEHLGELRIRLIRSGIAVIFGVLVCYLFSNAILDGLKRPLQILDREIHQFQVSDTGPSVETDGAVEQATWTVLNPLEPVIVKLKVAGYGGLLFAVPVILFQLCAFIFPGLRPNEKRAAQILLVGCSVLAFAGVLVAYFGVLPFVLPYLANFVPADVSIQLRLNETISMIVKALLGFGIAFQFPMVVLVLVYLGILTPATLKQYRKITIVGLAVFSAMLTPPDPITMSFMLVPLYGLYESSIWLSYLVVRRRARAEAAAHESPKE
jgi:sec-independent protein translocase protein TatC